ncbi:hypothetical protein JNB88_09880 [Rhizobium cauense]|uniref:hypothetical protein n=1 Tax=Rhizobium cauense TaxID=1166683 RepID=UPI001C6E39D0|nr:hypothetical protein [Rhizobium cauense]MBW9113944.1 hypothetical protein [Rhizobium cauense]
MLVRLPKITSDFETAFNAWWAAQTDDFRSTHDELEHRRGFKAGFTAGRKKTSRRYTFMTGKMKITIWAADVGSARALAVKEADRRFREYGLNPPKAGWSLRLLGNRGS